MDENLPRLTRELRQETCPPRVLEEVARRISAQAPPPNRLRYAIPATVMGLVLVCCLAVWQWPAGRNARPQPKAAMSAVLQRAQVAREAEGALGFIGSVLRDAGAHSEKVIFSEAVPPLRNSLLTARNRIIKRI
jgi:hypothetical protein